MTLSVVLDSVFFYVTVFLERSTVPVRIQHCNSARVYRSRGLISRGSLAESDSSNVPAGSPIKTRGYRSHDP